MDLPFATLLQSLQHGDTSIASEHTIVYTVLQWHEHQPVGTVEASQLKQLLEQVRMQHCSLQFINTVMMQSTIVIECFSPSDLGLAGMCSASPAVLQDANHPVLQKYPAWLAARRPLSSKQQLVEWQLPFREFQASLQVFFFR